MNIPLLTYICTYIRMHAYVCFRTNRRKLEDHRKFHIVQLWAPLQSIYLHKYANICTCVHISLCI